MVPEASRMKEGDLWERLAKIEQLFANAGTDGEKLAAEQAMARLRSRLAAQEGDERSEEIQFTLHDPHARLLFLALLRRYGLRSYRRKGQHRQTLLVRMPPSLAEDFLWPEFEELNGLLQQHLYEVTTSLIEREIHAEG